MTETGSRTVAAGTQYDFYEENLLAGYHFRYRKMGAVAYGHVANNYVAVFCHFIAPGVWEAVYVIEGLMKSSQLSVRADTVHSDTQGQSTTVFAFTHLLGINLMPRIRNWKDLHLFRPSRQAHYKNIDSLFAEAIDWDLIETHSKDLMQVALSIQQGKDLFGITAAQVGQLQPAKPSLSGSPGSGSSGTHHFSAAMDLQPAAPPTRDRYDQ